MMGARLDENGLTRDPNAITVYNGSAISYPVHVPVMASNGTSFIVAWRGGSGPTMSSGSNVMARAVTAAGDVPGSATAIAGSRRLRAHGHRDRVRRDGVLRLLERDRPGPRACRHSRGASRHGRCFSRAGDDRGHAPVDETRGGVLAEPLFARLHGSADQRTVADVHRDQAPSGACSSTTRSPRAPSSRSHPGRTTRSRRRRSPPTAPTGWSRGGTPLATRCGAPAWISTGTCSMPHRSRSPRIRRWGRSRHRSTERTTSSRGSRVASAWRRITTAGTILDPGGVPRPAGGAGPALAGRLLAYSRPASGRSRVVVRLRAPAPVVEDGGVDGAPADGGVPPSDGAVPPADGGVDSSPAEAGVDGAGRRNRQRCGERTGRNSPARTRRPTPRLPMLEAMQSPGGHRHRWPPFGHGCSVVDADTTVAPWVGLLFALVAAGRRRTSGAPRREGRVSERRAA